MNVTAATPTPQALLEQAMQAHLANQQDVARAGYEALLAIDPEHADALHLLGVLEGQLRQHERAAQLIGRAIAVKPDEPMFHNNLGNVEVERGNAEAAEAHYRRAVALDPSRLDAFSNLAVLFSHSDRHAEAEDLLQQVLKAAPRFEQARQNLANHYLRTGQLNAAAQACDEGLGFVPRNTVLRRVLGRAYTAMGQKKRAAEVYRAWLADEPDNAVAQHHLQACGDGETPARASDAYVREVFDGFAQSFDAKLEHLGYRAPQCVAEAVARHAGAPQRSLSVLDAGCGTGLCGPLLAPFAAALHGVDLSPRMLERAAQRGGYDTLACSELVAHLQGQPAAFDLIVSADTLCYFGELRPFAAAAAAGLRAGGLLVFTVEALPRDAAGGEPAAGPPFVLQTHGRYAHALSHVHQALAGAGLDVFETQAEVLRRESGKPVDGWLVSARLRAPQ